MTSMSAGTGTSRLSVVHRGIEYTGEMVRAERWQASYGGPLSGDTYFRVVFLERWSGERSVTVNDQRIAVCVAGQYPGKSWETATREIRILREARDEYLTNLTKVDADQARQTAEELELELLGEWARAYADGRILTQGSMHLDTSTIFIAGSYDQWTQRIAGALLAHAYPSLPLTASRDALVQALIQPERDAVLLFEWVTKGENRSELRAARQSCAQTLGLDSLRSQGERHPAMRRVLEHVRRAGGRIDGRTLGYRLAHEDGLTYPLATLFTLLALQHAAEPLSIRLQDGHAFKRRNGAPFEGRQLTGEMLSDLLWPVDFWRWVEWVGPRREEADEEVAPYVRILDPWIRLTAESTSAGIARRFWRFMGELRDLLPALEQKLHAIVEAQGGAMPEDAARSLTLLRKYASYEDEVVAAETPQKLWGPVREFRIAVERWRSWREHAALLTGLHHAVQYVRAALLTEPIELLAQRDALHAWLQERDIIMHPQRWGGLLEAFEQFREAYVASYLDYHRQHHAAMHLLEARMAVVRFHAETVQRLNAIKGIGAPVPPALLETVETMSARATACGHEPSVEELRRSPVCSRCHMRLGSAISGQEVARLEGVTLETLEQQRQRLGSGLGKLKTSQKNRSKVQHVQRMLLAGSAADFASIMDDELLRVIRQMLEERPPLHER